jgi:hypothetical protein
MNLGMWAYAIGIIDEGLQKVETKQIVSALNKKLVDCYEELGMFGKAFDVALKMFYNENKYYIFTLILIFHTFLYIYLRK